VSYVVTAYGVTLAALLGYGLAVSSAARALRAEISRARPNGG